MTSPAAPTGEQSRRAADDEPRNERPIPRRPGRGTFDPDAAERARAYKYARRRRAVLVLLLLTVGSAVAAVMVAPDFWIATGALGAVLVLFLVYLRRQVRIENEIRARRLAKLERARQIRPERPQTARAADPYSARSSRRSASAPHHGGRAVVDLDDDDPAFDDLEQYEPIEFRRAVGQ